MAGDKLQDVLLKLSNPFDMFPKFYIIYEDQKENYMHIEEL